jgi:hypothetical protein
MAKAKERVNKRNIFQLQERWEDFFAIEESCVVIVTALTNFVAS